MSGEPSNVWAASPKTPPGLPYPASGSGGLFGVVSLQYFWEGILHKDRCRLRMDSIWRSCGHLIELCLLHHAKRRRHRLLNMRRNMGSLPARASHPAANGRRCPHSHVNSPSEGIAAFWTSIEAVISNAASPRRRICTFTARSCEEVSHREEKSIKEEPLGELDDAFARIELKLVAQSA